MAATAALINGPQPMTVVSPVGAMVTFTCVVNTAEIPAGTKLFGFGSWIVNGALLSGSIGQQTVINGSLVIGTRKLLVIQDYITDGVPSGVPVLCQIVVLVSGILIALRSNNATLTAYGESCIY